MSASASVIDTADSAVSHPIPTAASSFIHLSHPRCQWKKGSILEYVSKARVFFDLLHNFITLFTGSPVNRVWIADRTTGIWSDFQVNLPPSNDILGAQMSPDKKFLAIRVSDSEVKIISTVTGEVAVARSCRTGSRMISVHWIKESNTVNTSIDGLPILFVTNSGIELYSFLVSSLRHIKTAGFPLVLHWISIEENFLLCLDPKGVFQAYRIANRSIVKLSRFELDCLNTSISQPANGLPFNRDQISLIPLYQKLYIGFVNEKRGQVHLLAINSATEEVEQLHVFEFGSPSVCSLGWIDNLLVAHCLTLKQSFIFDIKSDPRQSLLPAQPIGPPPLTSNYLSSHNQSFQSYFKWTFLAPNFIWESTGDQQQGNFWPIAVNLQAMTDAWPVGKRAKLLDFLMKRRNPEVKPIIYSIIRSMMIEESNSLVSVSRVFAMINRVLFDQQQQENTNRQQGIPLPLYSFQSEFGVFNYLGYLIIPQREILYEVFMKLRDGYEGNNSGGGSRNGTDENIAAINNDNNNNNNSTNPVPPRLSASVLIPFVVEYFRSIFRHYLRLDEELNEFLVRLLIDDGRYHELQQHLQYHIINDSVSVGELLIQLSDKYLPAYQMGLDMLIRLNSHTRLCSLLIQRGQILQAIKLIPSPRSPVFDAIGLQPKVWLAAAANTNNKILYYNIFKYFENRNFLLRQSNSFLPSDDCSPFVELYFKYFSRPPLVFTDPWANPAELFNSFDSNNNNNNSLDDRSNAENFSIVDYCDEFEADDPDWKIHTSRGRNFTERRMEAERRESAATESQANSPMKQVNASKQLDFSDSVVESKSLDENFARPDHFVDETVGSDEDEAELDESEENSLGVGVDSKSEIEAKLEFDTQQEEKRTTQPTFEFGV